jgi:hypothetical protein
MRIGGLQASKKKDKRYVIHIVDENKVKSYNFGLKGGETFIDHKDEAKRLAYLARHMSPGSKEKDLIENLIPSPALFSAVLLWGPNKTLGENVAALQKQFNMKYGK